MTMTLKTIAFGLAALPTLIFAQSAHANNELNKIPAKTATASTVKIAQHVLNPTQKLNDVTSGRKSIAMPTFIDKGALTAR